MLSWFDVKEFVLFPQTWYLAVLHLRLLRYSPQHISCWSCRLLLYVTQIFLFSLFPCFFVLEFRNLFLSVPSVLSCVLFCSLSCPSLSSFLLLVLLPDLFSPSLFIHFIFWSPFFSNLLSFLFFLFSYYSILSASPYVLLLFNLFSFC